jgi:hypothetical protein
VRPACAPAAPAAASRLPAPRPGGIQLVRPKKASRQRATHRRAAQAFVEMKNILYLAAGAAAFSFGAKKGAKSTPKPSAGRQVAKGGQTASTIVVPDTLKPFAGFGNPNIVAQRAAEREAKKAETLSKLIPTSVVQCRT